MFTLEQIKTAHAKTRTGADFPKYVHELGQLGVTGYTTFVTDGHTIFDGENNYTVQSEARYATIEIAEKSNDQQFRHDLKIHQGGETDYATFCRQAANSGVARWAVDTSARTCTYYNTSGSTILIEEIKA